MLRAIRTPAAQPSALARPGSEATAEADSLLNRATLAEAEQQAQLEVAPVAARYSAALAVQVEAKHAQVDRLEDKLETLIARQAETLSQVKARQPGLLSHPGTRAKWQRQVAQQQGTMTRLQDRLEHVRELRDTMGIHTPRIEEMAARKLRLQEPALAAEHDDWSSAARAHQALQRDQARRNRDRLTRGPGLALSLQRRPDR